MTVSRCLLVPSGSLAAALPSAGERAQSPLAASEQDLWVALADELRRAGAEVDHVELPRRDHTGPATGQDVSDRAESLRERLAASPVDTVIALSQGAAATVKALARAAAPRAVPRRLVLVGFVTESDVFLPDEVEQVDLVYGSGDHVAYVHGGDTRDAGALSGVPPTVYGGAVARRVLGAGLGEVQVHVLDGLGHTLRPVVTTPPFPEPGATTLARVITTHWNESKDSS